MTVKERTAVEREAKLFWESLSTSERFDLVDQLVLGEVDWIDWLGEKPPIGFWSAVDRLRLNWEV